MRTHLWPPRRRGGLRVVLVRVHDDDALLVHESSDRPRAGVHLRAGQRPRAHGDVERRLRDALTLEHARELQGRSIRANVGVELKGVSWS